MTEIESRGATLVTVSVDPLETSRKLVETLGLTFPVLGDTDVSVTRLYGIEEEAKDIARPVTYVIDREGRVVYAHVGEAPRDRPLLDEVLAAIPAKDP